jgi:enoyl-CoA hydratase
VGYQHIEVEHDGHLATVWLNRPKKLNAMSADMWRDIPEVMTDLDRDDSVRVVMVAGRGPAFTVGIDVNMLADLRPDGASEAEKSKKTYELIRQLQNTNSCFANSPKPVIAAIHGYCLGEGMNLISACDIRVATEDAQISVRETRMGLVADVGVLQRLPSIVGSGHVAELAFTGKDITGARASEIGLVNRVYPDLDEMLAGARELAYEIARNSPVVVSGIKRVLAANRGRTMEQALDYVAQWNAAYLFSNDLYEALGAFMEKRDPDFEGT